MTETCLVTGGSRGIGEAICKALGNAGNLVIGTATTSEGAQSITDYLSHLEIPGRGYRLDVRDQKSVDQLVSLVYWIFLALKFLNRIHLNSYVLISQMKHYNSNLINLCLNLNKIFMNGKA